MCLVKRRVCQIIKCIIFKISALLYGSQIGNHPRHIGSIDPHCDVLEVIKGKITAFDSTLQPPYKGAYPKIKFLISQSKYMLWVLKRTVSMRLRLLIPH